MPSVTEPPRYGRRRELLRWCGWYFFANWVLVLAISTQYLGHLSIPNEPLALTFTVLGFAGHFASLAFLPMLLMIPLTLVLPRRWLIVPVALSLGAALSLVIFLDTFIFDQYRFHINGMVVDMIFGGAVGEIYDVSAFMWTLFGLLGVAVIALHLGLGFGALKWMTINRGRWIGWAIGLALAGAFVAENVMYAWASAVSYTPITRQARYLPGFQPTSARGVLAAVGVVATPGVLGAAVPQGESGLNYPVQPLTCSANGPQWNVLVIVVDSWRFDMLNERVTPHMAALAEESWRFDEHYSGGNESRTGIFSLFYGLPATYWHAMLQEKRGPVLVHELLKRGYEPAIYGSAKLNSPEFDRTVFAEVPNLRMQSEGTHPYNRDRNITAEFNAYLDRRSAGAPPFFGFLFYDTPHGLYETPPGYPNPFRPFMKRINYFARGEGMDPEPLVNKYRNSVHFVDSLVGEVLNRLRATGQLERTIVAITGDHGEEFNDNGRGYWGHSGNFSRYQTQVPLLIRWPGEAPGTFTHRTGHVDLAPTLMRDLLGCTTESAAYSTGRHLLDTAERDFLVISAYNRFSVVEDDRITVYYYAGLVETYDSGYQELTGISPDSQLALEAMERIGRYYAR